MLIISPNNFNKVISKGTTLIYCWYEACKPCGPMTAILEKLEGNFTQFKFAKLNVVTYEGLKDRLEVKFTPQIVVYRAGVKLGYIVYQREEKLVQEFEKLADHQGTDLEFELPEALKIAWQ